MNHQMRWTRVMLALGLFGCGSLPDWTPLENQLKSGSAGSSAMSSGGTVSSTGATGGSTSIAGTTASAAGSISIAGTTASGGTDAGGAPTAGGGGGLSGGTGGSGGMVSQEDLDKAELADALKSLNGFIYESPCKFSNNGSDVTTLNGCNTSDICWSTQDLGEFSEFRNIPIGGMAGHTYQIDLDVLGVIEPRDYPAAPNCTRLPGQPASTAGILQCDDGYANRSSVGFNVWEFAIPSPATKYYFNGVPVHPMHRVDLVDNRFTFQVEAGSTIKFTMDDLNGGEIRDCSDVVTKSQYMTADGGEVKVSSTVPQPYNGQWMQLNVLDAKILH